MSCCFKFVFDINIRNISHFAFFKLNFEFISHNSDFFTHNSEFLSHISQFCFFFPPWNKKVKCTFFSHSCEFISRKCKVCQGNCEFVNFQFTSHNFSFCFHHEMVIAIFILQFWLFSQLWVYRSQYFCLFGFIAYKKDIHYLTILTFSLQLQVYIAFQLRLFFSQSEVRLCYELVVTALRSAWLEDSLSLFCNACSITTKDTWCLHIFVLEGLAWIFIPFISLFYSCKCALRIISTFKM